MLSLASVGVRAAILCEFQPLSESHSLILEKILSDLFLPFVCILSVRGLMNNCISIFAHINRQRPI